MDRKKIATSQTLNFLKDNVLTVTDLTRSNRLSEILNKYAGEETSEIYVIQNAKNRDATAVLVDLEHYVRLLKIQEVFEKTLDEHMYQIALQRKDEKAVLSLSEVIDANDFELDKLIDSITNLDLDDE
ncbi:hypothetical protein ASZ90_017327 [hydrocarbon metagenome]|uniref:Antitoxin n=1 Tax=hydrocarbon metagenome TaxID=938273 RepID=A0A0W8E9W1_9ZZZZ